VRTEGLADARGALEQRLLAWGAWLSGGGRGDGYPAMSVLHVNWMPPAPGQTPTLKTSARDDARERALHQIIGGLPQRLSDTLVTVYVHKVSAAERSQRLGCQESTVYSRLEEARRVIGERMHWTADQVQRARDEEQQRRARKAGIQLLGGFTS